MLPEPASPLDRDPSSIFPSSLRPPRRTHVPAPLLLGETYGLCAELSSTFERVTGDVPLNLTGASLTQGGSILYLFGGKLSSSHQSRPERASNQLYSFDFETRHWSLLWSDLKQSRREGPVGRIDHSASYWPTGGIQGQLVIFGGRCLNEVGLWKASDQLLVWDLAERVWSFPTLKPGIVVGKLNEGRYGHLTEIIQSESLLGGSRVPSTSMLICGGRDSKDQVCTDGFVLSLERMTWIKRVKYQALQKDKSWVGSVLIRKSVAGNLGEGEETIMVFNGEKNIQECHLLTSIKSNPFTQTPFVDFLPGSLPQVRLTSPTVHRISDTFILTGFATEGFLIFALKAFGIVTEERRWKKLRVASKIGRGRWKSSFLIGNQLVLIGSFEQASRSLDEPALNYSETAVVELEAFGVLQPPKYFLSERARTLGSMYSSLSALHNFDLLTSDGERVGANRKLLELSWPGFARQLRNPEPFGLTPAKRKYGTSSREDTDDYDYIPNTPRQYMIPLSTSATQAMLQFFATRSLAQDLHTPETLMELLLFTSQDGTLENLWKVVIEALHALLDDGSRRMVGQICETATLANEKNLLLRCIRILDEMEPESKPPPTPDKDAFGPTFASPFGTASIVPHLRFTSAIPTPLALYSSQASIVGDGNQHLHNKMSQRRESFTRSSSLANSTQRGSIHMLFGPGPTTPPYTTGERRSSTSSLGVPYSPGRGSMDKLTRSWREQEEIEHQERMERSRRQAELDCLPTDSHSLAVDYRRSLLHSPTFAVSPMSLADSFDSGWTETSNMAEVGVGATLVKGLKKKFSMGGGGGLAGTLKLDSWMHSRGSIAGNVGK